MPPAPRTPESDPRNVWFARRTLSALLGLLAAISLVMVAALLLIALQLNRDASNHSQRLVDKLWRATHQQLITTTRDYAFWGEAYRALHLQHDTEWAYDRDNLGASLFKTFHFEGVFVINGQNQTTYALDQGNLSDTTLQSWLGSFPASLIEDARNSEDEEHVATRILNVQGQPVFVSAARLTPGTDPAVQRLAGVQSVLVLAYRLSPPKLKHLGNSYEIAHLRIPLDQQDATRQPQLQIDPQLLLRWDPERPGHRLLRVLLPILLLLLGALLLVSRGIRRRALNNAQLMDQQYAMISASRSALASSEARFRNVAEAASDWFWETASDLRITYLSERFTAVTGQAAQDWLGRRLDEMLDCPEQRLDQWIHAQHASATRSVIRCTHQAPDGQTLTSLIAVKPILHDGQIVGYQGSASDITREVAVEQRLRQLSWHDALTGLANRSQLREFLEAQLQQQLPHQGMPLTLLSLDLDHFKPVNDLYGHSGGDSVLREVARRLARCLPQGALLARQGGDEFIMVAPALASRHAVEQLCLTLIASICQPFILNGQEITIGLSIGIACAPTDGVEPDDLLRFSDLALYQAKHNGRNTWRFYEPQMTERMQQRRELERDLHIALRHGQFSLRYQPRHAVSSGRICGAEALIRWEHPQLGLCMPDQFISLAEENGLIVALSDWVLRRACSDAMQWGDDVLVSVNISAIEFRLGGLVERIRSVLAATGLPPQRLELELTERVVIEDAPSCLELMTALKRLGVRLAMDDFGTGYSSLSYLKDLPFDTLKIDRSFISEIEHSAQGRAIVRAIIDLGRALSLTITAEGVETGQQLQHLQDLTCDEAQGYFLNRPMPLAALLQAIEGQNVHALDV
ncbi:EAL domain-containing protein [Pseudomonas sp. 21LCFQ02]|uniref:bifunctional diguanylate cyclase/phosphodiesterase n=1 Tax=Pseudomonas sp. 21LCFQ02 TaxID=2957505 RepID=UPI00209AB62B|nr:EAL domain-containing protein [Pseudomonas sp. 21LCFQ02]MCO8168797.1 EAL domain-containing protein [Pseudomonas sp. 21LCFQ02]